jgi:hypothetical protein
MIDASPPRSQRRRCVDQIGLREHQLIDARPRSSYRTTCPHRSRIPGIRLTLTRFRSGWPKPASPAHHTSWKAVIREQVADRPFKKRSILFADLKGDQAASGMLASDIGRLAVSESRAHSLRGGISFPSLEMSRINCDFFR